MRVSNLHRAVTLAGMQCCLQAHLEILVTVGTGARGAQCIAASLLHWSMTDPLQNALHIQLVEVKGFR
ncbi:hypothetical protein [Ferrimicrobium sp.]|uniref:hypothetical protein n=1 Tax=Ferrimicrobium sp. TaxID=2926050 RepID=UPI00260A5A97|nr:hypothetical protein [Ferrimicrobium sp.]